MNNWQRNADFACANHTQPTFTPYQAQSDFRNSPCEQPNSSDIPDVLERNIGRLVRVEFLTGDCLSSRTGVLCDVSDNYIILGSENGRCQTLCDIDNIVFVTVSTC